jgi:hypothetical protein
MRTAFSIVAAACALSSCSGEARERSDAGAAGAVTGLPLRHGFYVADDVACSQASGASLLLVLRDGVTGSRDFCTFGAIERTGSTRYRVSEECASTEPVSGGTQAQLVTWEIPDSVSFTSRSDAGWRRAARYCEQSVLPEPWRDNDLSAVISEPSD